MITERTVDGSTDRTIYFGDTGTGASYGFEYLRPGGIDYYKQPGGTYFYLRP